MIVQDNKNALPRFKRFSKPGVYCIECGFPYNFTLGDTSKETHMSLYNHHFNPGRKVNVTATSN